MNDHLKGLVLTTLGILLIIPDSLFVRLIVAETMVTSFWRGMTAGVVVLIFILLFQGIHPFKTLMRGGWSVVIYIILTASTAPAFVLAISNTSVANAVFIFSSMPIFAAIFSKIFLNESMDKRMLITMFFVFIGLGVIAYGSKGSAIASWQGDAWALYVSMAYAAGLTAIRRVKNISMIPAIPIAYIGAALLLWPFTEPLVIVAGQWELLAGHGMFIAAGSCLLALGPRYISAAEVSLLVLLESVLAPILVWMVIGENPGIMALIGGAIVISALIASNAYELHKRRQSTP